MVGALGVWGAAPAERASAGVSTTSTIGYGWPIKPFNQAHPVRANFGDPRMIFRGAPTERTLYHGRGSFHFHRGVDIYGPDGADVYPVRDGNVVFENSSHINIQSPDGTVFEYWHIGSYLPVGTSVRAYRTVLGSIARAFGHVDLTELDDGKSVNPLAPGHLTPYRDRTRPVVASIHLQRNDDGHSLLPNFVRGRVWLVVEAYDRPSLSLPPTSPWRGLPITPACVTWRIKPVKVKGPVPVSPSRVAVDFRTTEPSQRAFWSVYARGTYQNMTVFDGHESFMQPGRYLFRLSPTKFDTRSLPDGVYDLVVTATDIRSHSSSRSLRVDIHNRSGYAGS